ncbi:MAG: hypothetical protein ACTH0S_09050 [Senegalia sp. (in: firmicutes)]
MKIKDKIFITNSKYSALYAGKEKGDIQFKESLENFEDLSSNNWSILIQFDVIGLDNITNSDLEKDGIVLLTYSELPSKELRFDGMQGTQIKNGKNLKKSYGMGLPHGVDINNIDNVYLKILYIPNAFTESPDSTDPFHYMLNDTENELAKLTFPLPLLKRGNVNE